MLQGTFIWVDQVLCFHAISLEAFRRRCKACCGSDLDDAGCTSDSHLPPGHSCLSP